MCVVSNLIYFRFSMFLFNVVCEFNLFIVDVDVHFGSSYIF